MRAIGHSYYINYDKKGVFIYNLAVLRVVEEMVWEKV